MKATRCTQVCVLLNMLQVYDELLRQVKTDQYVRKIWLIQI